MVHQAIALEVAMAIGSSQSAQVLLKSWRDEHTMGGFFAWLAELGRKDEEVREILVKSVNCSAPSKWHQTDKGNVVVEIEATVDSFDISVTFADQGTAQRRFTERELRFGGAKTL
jgi:hypothetical protein